MENFINMKLLDKFEEIESEEEIYSKVDDWYELKEKLPEVGSSIILAQRVENTPYYTYYNCENITKDDIKEFYKEGSRHDMYAYTRRVMKDGDLYQKDNVNFSIAGLNNPYWEEYEEQRKVRGFDDTELWNLDVTIIKFMLPRLKVFRDKTHGYPSDFSTFEDWQAAIDDMIYWMEKYVDDDCFTHDTDEREARGFEAFKKYFTALWD